MAKSKRKRGPRSISIGANKVRALLDGRPQTWLAEQSGVSKHKIYDWLAGRGKIAPWEILKISEVFGVEPECLIDDARSIAGYAKSHGRPIEPPPGSLGIDSERVDEAPKGLRSPQKRRGLR